MGAAALSYDDDGNVAWDQMWTRYCELVMARRPSYRGTLLEPVDTLTIEADRAAYEQVLAELERRLRLVTGRPVVQRALARISNSPAKSRMSSPW